MSEISTVFDHLEGIRNRELHPQYEETEIGALFQAQVFCVYFDEFRIYCKPSIKIP